MRRCCHQPGHPPAPHACRADSRRDFLARLGAVPLLLTPLAAALSGCAKKGWPEGMAEIKWDRDTCTRCSMVISDRRFAVELRGGPGDSAYKFDDIGCMVSWMQDKAEERKWAHDAATRMWVADFDSKSREQMRWLDPRRAFFVTRTSPMAYNFAAVAVPQAGALDFNDVRQHALAKSR